MTKIVELIITEEDENKLNQDGCFAISLVSDPAIEVNWIALKKEQKDKVLFAKVDEDKRLIIAPALIPNKQILRIDDDGSDYYVYFSKNTIKTASELYMQRNHLQNATIEHQEEVEGLCVVESWLKEATIDKSANYGFSDLPIGTWFVKMKIDNDNVWKMIKEGVIKGLSIEGYFTDKLQALSTIDENSDLNKIAQIKNLIERFEAKYLESYPWDSCVADQMSKGYSKEESNKICGAIKNRTIEQSIQEDLKKILSTKGNK
jgi:hypothetical protein